MTNNHPAEIRWQGSRWLRPHAIAAPFGIFLATVFLQWVTAEQPFDRGDVRSLASLVDFGVVLYAMVAVSVETGVRAVFWALDQRRQWRARMRAEMKEETKEEAKAEVRAEMKAAVRDEVKAAVRDEVITETRAATLAEALAVIDAGGNLKEWLDHAVATLEEDQPQK